MTQNKTKEKRHDVKKPKRKNGVKALSLQASGSGSIPSTTYVRSDPGVQGWELALSLKPGVLTG